MDEETQVKREHTINSAAELMGIQDYVLGLPEKPKPPKIELTEEQKKQKRDDLAQLRKELEQEENRGLRVKDLIEILSKVEGNPLITIEGCDCSSNLHGTALVDGTFYLLREDGVCRSEKWHRKAMGKE